MNKIKQFIIENLCYFYLGFVLGICDVHYYQLKFYLITIPMILLIEFKCVNRIKNNNH